MIHNQKPSVFLLTYLSLSLLVLLSFSACTGWEKIAISTPSDSAIWESPTLIKSPPSSLTASPTFITPTSTIPPTRTITLGPSPTSTPLPPLEPKGWQAQPIMIEGARIASDPLDPFRYTPFFILYGDGLLVTRSCQEGDCQYLQTQLDQQRLCRLVNTINRTGFLYADPHNLRLPGVTGNEIRLAVQVYEDNHVQIPDLDSWVESPEWYGGYVGCLNCFDPPIIDPAFIDLFRLLSAYETPNASGLAIQRLALWISEPVIAGPPKPWSPDLIALSELQNRSICREDPAQRRAVILEGEMAQAVADYIAIQGGTTPIFSQGEAVWQVQSRWLIPYEMPQTCQRPPGMVAPSEYPGISWMCEPEMGAIPTATSTITPTPTTTPTPLR